MLVTKLIIAKMKHIVTMAITLPFLFVSVIFVVYLFKMLDNFYSTTPKRYTVFCL